MNKIRVRFAPSPTGALHIGGVRTALYNYLFAKKHEGTFILRIEDTDQTRYVQGAEEYIMQALEWCGIHPDEGPGFNGDYGPYRQSERKSLYQSYAHRLVKSGNAYYAFDTPEELEAMRMMMKEKGVHTPKYDAVVRVDMRNGITLDPVEVNELIRSGTPYTIRMKVPENETVMVEDMIRGTVKFETKELDDKVIIKADGLPTYHLANIVDDHKMKISHVIRGEEWLPSTAHHVLLYKSFGWDGSMPQFAHLPLILKPSGKGKLSKRDGTKLGIPVFPLSWNGETPEDSFTGFREWGFDPKAVINFLAFLGWNPGTEKEIFSLEELTREFSIDQIGKSGARFDFDKAKWFNQQYIINSSDEDLLEVVKDLLKEQGISIDDDEFIKKFAGLLKERTEVYPDFLEEGIWFFTSPDHYDEKTVRKKFKLENLIHFRNLSDLLGSTEFIPEAIETTIKSYIHENDLGFGSVMPVLRIAISGSMKGPDLFQSMALIGKEKILARLEKALEAFPKMIEA